MKSTIRFFSAVCITLLIAGSIFTGCKKNDNPVTDETVVTTDEVAYAVSDALASNNGGAIDQVNDVFEIAGGAGVGGGEALGKAYGDSTLLKFNANDTSWSLYIYRARAIGWWSRTYWHQFIGSNGKAQQSRVGAVTVKHKIVSGSGHFQTLRLIHDLTSLSSNWTANLNADTTVTINGTYARSGRDSVILGTRKGSKFVSALSLTFTDVKGPRGSRMNRSEKTSGKIEGVHTATVTVPGKAPFTITKTFTITLGGGSATFTIDGTKFTADLSTGNY